MRISFDLDDTLICYEQSVPREKHRAPFWARLFGSEIEPLRAGAIQLIQELQTQGHEIWIYTTSNRDPKALKRWFAWHGVKISSVVNADVHARVVPEKLRRAASKAPEAFGIELHIDDEDYIVGNFRLLTVTKDDSNWADKVRAVVKEMVTAPPLAPITGKHKWPNLPALRQEDLANYERAIVFVWAAWSPPDKMFSPIVERAAREFENQISFFAADLYEPELVDFFTRNSVRTNPAILLFLSR